MPSRRNPSVKAARASFLSAVVIFPPMTEASIFCSKSDWRPDKTASGTSGLRNAGLSVMAMTTLVANMLKLVSGSRV